MLFAPGFGTSSVVTSFKTVRIKAQKGSRNGTLSLNFSSPRPDFMLPSSCCCEIYEKMGSEQINLEISAHAATDCFLQGVKLITGETPQQFPPSPHTSHLSCCSTTQPRSVSSVLSVQRGCFVTLHFFKVESPSVVSSSFVTHGHTIRWNSPGRILGETLHPQRSL